MINQQSNIPNYNGPGYGLIGGSQTSQLQQQPSEPSLQSKADELTKFIGELEHNLDRINAALFGEIPQVGSDTPSNALNPPINLKIAWATTRIASLCGFSATILGKLNPER